MPRLPRAMTTLIEEIREIVPDLTVKPDNLDGLKVYRTVRLTSDDYKGLDDLASVVRDRRIADVKSVGKGVEVTFVGHALGDINDSFGVEDGHGLVTKKRAAKKTAAKKTAASKDADDAG